VTALDVLDLLARLPGSIFNASRYGQLLDLDKRTVDRYLGVFGRLFLLHWLPNLATAPGAQTHTRAKIHPVDTALSVEALERGGARILESRELFGQLFESYAVNQILAARTWAERSTQAHYWRQAGAPSYEVDLVLQGFGGSTVGIEVKSSSTVGPGDLKGLRALNAKRGLDRGFVIYTGSEVRQLDQAIWALPAAALSSDAWASPAANPRAAP
jgi:predicted AAA+ superfamily ATPase